MTYYDICLNIYYNLVLRIITTNKPKFNPSYMPGDFPPRDRSYLTFFNNKQAQEYLGVRKTEFVALNRTINQVFGRRDLATDMVPYISRLLRDGVKGVVLAGDLDFVTNFQQSESTTKEFVWKGQVKWNWLGYRRCRVGLCRELMNLREYRVFFGGHGVGAYEPKAELEIVNAMLEWEPEM